MTELHVVDQPGPADAPLVVLIHGTMDRSNSFSRTMGLLDDVSVIAYDRRGYARSRFASPPANTVGDHVDDLFSILDGRAGVLVGHSYGGVVALAASVRSPELIRSVGAFEAPMPWLPEWPNDTAGGEALRAALRGGDPDAAVEAFLRRMLGDEAWEMMPKRAREDRLGEGPALVSDMKSLRGAPDLPPPFDPADVKVPVVVGWGSRSRPHQIDSSNRLVATLADVEPYVIEDARHGAHLSHPEAFAQFIRAAVARAQPV